MHQVFFWIFASVAVGAGLLAITRKAALHCALSLVVSFVALAGLYFQLKAPFPGILQVMLYAGAIMVLVIFVIMFLNAPEEDPSEKISKPGVIASVFLLIPFAALLIGVILHSNLPVPGAVAPDFGTVASIGTRLFGTWTWVFEVLSLLLLAALVAAVLLAKKRLD